MAAEKIRLNIGICDDDSSMLERLTQICRDVLGESYDLRIAADQTAACLLSQKFPFQLAILDVRLEESSGIELAREILRRNGSCRILFVSGHLESVSQVYEVPHFCLVLKDRLELLPQFLQRAAGLAAKDAGKSIQVWYGRKILPVVLSDITFAERRCHWTYLNLKDGSVLQIREKLGDLLQRANDPDFIRCHVSFLVNLQNVAGLQDGAFCLTGGGQVPISRPNEKACRDAFFHHLGEIPR